MTTPQQQFLELLRSGLWGKAADTTLFQKGVDWKAILRIATEQTVQVIVADGIETLPEELWPPKEIMLKLMMIRIKTQQLHNLLNSTLNQIVEALNAENIPSVLLKGQGVAQNYRKPESRSCGDIDIYIGRENFVKGCEIIRNLNKKEQTDTPECEHHIEFNLNGVVIEVHKIAAIINQKCMAEDFAEWTNRATIDNTSSFYEHKGTRIHIPEHTYNAIFILYHGVRHMYSEGVGFRQICDWAMFLYKNHQHIIVHELETKLKKYKLTEIWKGFCILANKTLGLPKEYIPLYPKNDISNTTESLTKQIFISGNFGKFDKQKRPQNDKCYIKNKWRNFYYQSSRLSKLFFIFPFFTITYGWGWFSVAFVRFLRYFSCK